MDNGRDSSIIEFVDIGENEKAIALVDLIANGLKLCLSLEHGSDTEVVMPHSDAVKLVNMLQKAIDENEARIIQRIDSLIKSELPELAPQLRNWAEQHLTIPRQVSFALSDDGTGEIRLWLVTDRTGKNDSSSRIVFDEIRGDFGLAMLLKNGVDWFMGFYGGFAETVDAI